MVSRSVDQGPAPPVPTEPAFNQLCDKLDSIEQRVSELSYGRLAAVEKALNLLRELLSAQRKDNFLVHEIAAKTGRSEYTVRRWIAMGKIKAIRIAEGGPRGRLLVPRAELERLIASGKGGDIPDSAIG